jgi:hypothetical protein
MDNESSTKRRFFSPGECLGIHCATLLACSLSFLGVCILPYADPWMDQCAGAATSGERTAGEPGEADFSQSVMIGPTHKIREDDTIDYEIILRNTGTERPDYVELWTGTDSSSAMLGSGSEMSYNREARRLHWRGAVGPGEERHFTFKLVTTPQSAGTWASAYASVIWVSTHWDIQRRDIQVEPIEVRSKESNARVLFTVGGIEIGWLEAAILGYFLFVPLFLTTVPRLIRWRERRRVERSPDVSQDSDIGPPIMVYAMSIAFVASIAFMPFFASFVVKDVRKYTSYEKTTCTILDKTMRWRKGSTGSSGKAKTYYDLLVSVRYNVKAREILSARFLARDLGRETSAEKRLARFDIGKSYPCWFDPEDPREFVLSRGLSWGWYLLFVGPLVLLGISSRYLLGKLRGPNPPSQTFYAPIQ